MAFPRSVRSLVFGILIALCAGSLLAADGIITGRVTRSDGTGVGGVIVNVVEASEGVLTDQSGNFTVAVPPGTYSIQFVAGDQTASEGNVIVTSGDRKTTR